MPHPNTLPPSPQGIDVLTHHVIKEHNVIVWDNILKERMRKKWFDAQQKYVHIRHVVCPQIYQITIW